MKNILVILLCVSVALVPELAAAGGLDSAKTEATNWRLWFYGMCGIGAGGYILYEFIQAWAKRNTWMDVATAMMWVAAAGGAIGLADYLWGIWA